jgi:hypothetical protein
MILASYWAARKRLAGARTGYGCAAPGCDIERELALFAGELALNVTDGSLRLNQARQKLDGNKNGRLRCL